jgi:2,4-dienoyl-CoA reductase (NADPH2)
MAAARLLQPGSIAGMRLKNRIILAAMGSNFAETDGSCGERITAYYEERARGGTGLLIMETAAVAWPAGATMPNTVGFSEDRFLPGLSELASRVHRHGARIAAQLNHGGKVAQEDVAEGRPVLVPSLPKPARSDMFELLTASELANFVKAAGPDGKGPRYREMDQSDIATLVRQFAEAAGRAKQAGFDAVELHAGHGYVLSSFLSPAVNHRQDGYGGSLENRARLLCEVIRAVRAEVGAGYPILVRLGSTARGIAFTEAPLVHQEAGFVPFARAVKAAVSIPVIAVGRIEIDVAERGLRRGNFDFVAMGRKLLADPELPNKLAAGREKDIRPCIYCYVCVSKIFINQPMCCAVNPACGREAELNVIASDADAGRALVVGGGPGGLEAARVLSDRGFKVSLVEQDRDLGGTARIAALPYEPNGRLVKHLVQEVKARPIEIRSGQRATLESIVAEAPDAVIVATGANRAAPPIPGKEGRQVFDGNELRGLLFGTDPGAARKLSHWQRLVVLTGRLTQLLRSITALRLLSRLWMPLSKRVVLIGGGLVGLELAEYLVERGRTVTVLEPSADLGAELSIVRRARVVHELREHGVELQRNAEVSRITEQEVHYQVEGESRTVAADNVIIAMGAQPQPDLAHELAAAGIRAMAVGDCHEVGYIEGAVLSGREAALEIASR